MRLTAEIQLKYFVLTLEDSGDVLTQEATVSEASHMVFQFYKRVLVMKKRYAKLVPGLEATHSGAGFNVEGWLSPFMYKWLNQLSGKTVEWVSNAVKLDSFNPDDGPHDQEPPHSVSITDLFSALYSELEFITNLEWSNPLQNARFFQMYGKVILFINRRLSMLLLNTIQTRYLPRIEAKVH